jgi:hypothetical protein
MIISCLTFKDLHKLIQSSQSEPEQSQLLQRLRDKPFGIWDSTSHKQTDRVTKEIAASIIS